MKANDATSRYQKADDVGTEFNSEERRKAGIILRRLRFLETKIAEHEATDKQPTAATAFIVWEMDALAWILIEIGYIKPTK